MRRNAGYRRSIRTTAAFPGSASTVTHRCLTLPEDVGGPLRPVEIVRPLRSVVARLPAIVRLAGPSWSAPVKGSTMWPIVPESSGRTHPSQGRSRGFARKTSCRGVYTASHREFTLRSFTRSELVMLGSVMPSSEALAHESLFRAFEIPPGSCPPVRRQVQEEHPARLSPRDAESENIQSPERECPS